MKKRCALICVLLLVAFMWSCQAEKSSPFAPDGVTTLAADGGNGTATVAKKGGNGGKVDKDATYTVEVFFGEAPALVEPYDGATMEPNWLMAMGMYLDLTGLIPHLLDGCFAVAEAPYLGDLYLGSNISFFFDVDGRRHYLMMENGAIEGPWPPANEGVPTIFEGSGLRLVSKIRKVKTDCPADLSWRIVVTKNPIS